MALDGEERSFAYGRAIQCHGRPRSCDPEGGPNFTTGGVATLGRRCATTGASILPCREIWLRAARALGRSTGPKWRRSDPNTLLRGGSRRHVLFCSVSGGRKPTRSPLINREGPNWETARSPLGSRPRSRLNEFVNHNQAVTGTHRTTLWRRGTNIFSITHHLVPPGTAEEHAGGHSPLIGTQFGHRERLK